MKTNSTFEGDIMDLESLLDKRVKVITKDNKVFIGKVLGYVPAHDNEPEIDEIDISNEKDNRDYSLFENEIKSLEVL